LLREAPEMQDFTAFVPTLELTAETKHGEG
jgi:hypothetical protein